VGPGKAIAAELLALGCNVVIASRSQVDASSACRCGVVVCATVRGGVRLCSHSRLGQRPSTCVIYPYP
jgi:hypothetical protein